MVKARCAIYRGKAQHTSSGGGGASASSSAVYDDNAHYDSHTTTVTITHHFDERREEDACVSVDKAEDLFDLFDEAVTRGGPTVRKATAWLLAKV